MTGGLRHAGDEDNFVIIPRPTIRDERLSWQARGLLTFILDLPSGWEIKASWLATQGPAGEEAVYSILRELKACGYYRVERRRGPDGKFVSGTAVSKRARPSWAAQYAAECEARAAKRKVEAPIVEVLEDGTVLADDEITDGSQADTPADLAVARNRANREAVDPVMVNRVPAEPESQGGARTEEREGETTARSMSSHQSNAGARARPASRTADLDPLPPPPPMGIRRSRKTDAEWQALRRRLEHPDREPAPELPEEDRRLLADAVHPPG